MNAYAAPITAQDPKHGAQSELDRFLTKHGGSLGTLVDDLGSRQGVEAVSDLTLANAAIMPDNARIIELLTILRDELMSMPTEIIVFAARLPGGPGILLDAVRWHGARLDELLNRLRT